MSVQTETAPASAAIQAQGFDHVAIWVRDLSASVEWYQRVLGLPIAHGDDHHVFLRVGDEVLALFQADGTPAGGPHHLAIRVPDVERALDSVRTHGIEPRKSGPSLGFADLDGNWIHFSGSRGGG